MAKVLVIDDEHVYCDNLRLFLVEAGHEVKTASSGNEGIRIGGSFRPDVLVVDWRLRDCVDGVEVAGALRAENPELKTIFMTGYSAEELASKLPDDAGIEILEKPFSLQEIADAVRRARSGGFPGKN